MILQDRVINRIVFALQFACLLAAGCSQDSQSENAPIDNGPATDTESVRDGGHCEESGDTEPDTFDDRDRDSGPDATIEAVVDSGPSVDIDASIGTPCSEDMTYVPANPEIGIDKGFCIDRFEAARKDATATSGGYDNAIAYSKSGVIPWYENPMNEAVLAMFKTACVSAGKRLCRSEEWFGACTGVEMNRYVFGNFFDSETCNSVNSFCDDYCVDNGIPTTDCNTAVNCGYDCGYTGQYIACLHVTPTESFPKCTNSYGTYDMNGNVWEIVSSKTNSSGYEIRGGAFNCAGPVDRLRCEYNADWTTLNAGFRCCKDPVK